MNEIIKRIIKDILDYKIVIIVVAVYYIFVHVVFHAFCPLVLVTGLPCAGCGMTRAVFFMLTGQLARSFRLNPMALPVILFVLYCFYCRYIVGKKMKGFSIGVGILAVLLVSCYLYRMVTIFPNRPPYVYTAGNLLEKMIPHYREYLKILFNI